MGKGVPGQVSALLAGEETAVFDAGVVGLELGGGGGNLGLGVVVAAGEAEIHLNWYYDS